MIHNILLKGARVVDPKNNIDKISDIAITDNYISAVQENLDPGSANETIDVTGLVAMPGVIDGHVHLSSWIGGPAGYRMMAKAGTVTAIDFAGPFSEIIDSANTDGYGLNIGGLEAIRPGENVSKINPTDDELREFVRSVLASGALGIKILGGHFPMTPDATNRAIQIANEEGAYVAFHVGTSTISRSDLNSLRQALELADGNRIHICHVCTCCLGLVLGDPLIELNNMMDMLSTHPNAVSESHLSVPAYSFAQFESGKPQSNSTSMFLEIAGYSLDEYGLRDAMLDGYTTAVIEIEGENQFVGGNKAYKEWKEGRVQALGFKGNLPISLIVSAIHKTNGKFTVNALASDGGGIPRNNLLTAGTALVNMGAMSFRELATKLCVAPAEMYQMTSKGHLGVGADADVTIIDPISGKAVYSFGMGRMILKNMELTDCTSATLITTQMTTNLPKSFRTIKLPPYPKYMPVGEL